MKISGEIFMKIGEQKLDRPWEDSKEPRPSFNGFRNSLVDQGRLRVSKREDRKRPDLPLRKASERVNVLYLMADQLRADTFGFMGHPSIKTPNLDRLAGEGAFLTRSYCSSPVCAPSRATFMTGEYVGRNGVVQNGVKMTGDAVVFPKVLSENGYRTANIAKVHCGRGVQDIWEFHEGVHDVFGATKPSSVPFVPSNYPELKFIGGHDCDNPNCVLYGKYPGPVETTKSFLCANAAMKWLYYHDDPRPFFLRVSFDDPHPPVVPPEPFAGMYSPEDVPEDLLEGFEQSIMNKPQSIKEFRKYKLCDRISEQDHRIHAARYMALVSHLDAQIGRIIDYLDRTEFSANTIVVVNSDHGHMTGEHGLSHKGSFLFEGVCRIPTVIRWPGKIQPGTKVDAVVDAVDFVPTIYEMLGVESPVKLPGKSFLPLLTGEAEKIRDYAFVHWDDYGFGIIGKEWKLTYFDCDGEGELYNLNEDPLEKNNLYNEPGLADKKEELMKLLMRWREKFGPGPPG